MIALLSIHVHSQHVQSFTSELWLAAADFLLISAGMPHTTAEAAQQQVLDTVRSVAVTKEWPAAAQMAS